MKYLIIINLISFIIYGIDKFSSKHKLYRIPEVFLFLLSIVGGGLGSLLGMYIFRHKTKKVLFYIVNYLCLGIWIYIIWRFL